MFTFTNPTKKTFYLTSSKKVIYEVNLPLISNTKHYHRRTEGRPNDVPEMTVTGLSGLRMSRIPSSANTVYR